MPVVCVAGLAKDKPSNPQLYLAKVLRGEPPPPEDEENMYTGSRNNFKYYAATGAFAIVKPMLLAMDEHRPGDQQAYVVVRRDTPSLAAFPRPYTPFPICTRAPPAARVRVLEWTRVPHCAVVSHMPWPSLRLEACSGVSPCTPHAPVLAWRRGRHTSRPA